jgi:hypothetical protein
VFATTLNRAGMLLARSLNNSTATGVFAGIEPTENFRYTTRVVPDVPSIKVVAVPERPVGWLAVT